MCYFLRGDEIHRLLDYLYAWDDDVHPDAEGGQKNQFTKGFNIPLPKGILWEVIGIQMP